MTELEQIRAALTNAAELLEYLATKGFYFTEWSTGTEREPEVRRQRCAVAAAEARAALAVSPPERTPHP